MRDLSNEKLHFIYAGEYKGIYDLDEDRLVEFHRQRINHIAQNLLKSKHLIAFETIPNVTEVKALIRLIEQYDDLNAWLSFSCRDEKCIADGTPIEQIVELVRGVKQIFAIGVNCVQPEYVEGLLQRMKQAKPNKLLLIYPNNGDVYDEKTRTFSANSLRLNYIDKVSEWRTKYDLAIIGGCCRIGPKEIARIRSFFVQQS